MGDLFSKISLTGKFSPLQFIQNFWIRLTKIQEDFRKKTTMRGNKKPPERPEYFLTFSKQNQIG